MLIDLVEAHPLEDHRVYLRFEDGLEGELDLGKRLSFRGVFAPLRDPKCFRELHVNPALGAICWPNGADLAPERLYTWLKEALASRQTQSAPS